MRLRVLPVSAFLLLILFTACPQQQQQLTPQQLLADAAKAIEAVSISAQGAVNVVLTAMPDNTPERQEILGIIAKVVQADTHAAIIVKSLEGKTYSGISDLSPIILPILAELRKTIDDGLAGIKNPDSQKKAQTYIDSIAIAINTFQVTLELYGVKPK